MSTQRPKHPKTMGQVLESFAAAVKDERKRGLPRFSDAQVERIEAVVHHLDAGRTATSPSRDASPSQPPRSHVPTEKPSPQTLARPAATTPPDATPPDTTGPDETASSGTAPSNVGPSNAAPAGEMLPWMVDESAAAAPSAQSAPAASPSAASSSAPSPSDASSAAAHAHTPDAAPTHSADAPHPADREDAAVRAQPQAPCAPTTAAPQPTPPTQKAARLQEIRKELVDCTRCGLCETRTNIVFGDGDPNARILLVGEAPSHNDDESGRLFSDEAGNLLGNMLKAMTLSREEVYITTVLKCHPPNNRSATREELGTCAPFLRKQIEAVQPEVIITLGSQASRLLLGARFPFAQNRGQWNTWENIPVMPTWHPGYLLRHPQEKASAWKDLQQVMKKIGLT